MHKLVSLLSFAGQTNEAPKEPSGKSLYNQEHWTSMYFCQQMWTFVGKVKEFIPLLIVFSIVELSVFLPLICWRFWTKCLRWSHPWMHIWIVDYKGWVHKFFWYTRFVRILVKTADRTHTLICFVWLSIASSTFLYVSLKLCNCKL